MTDQETTEGKTMNILGIDPGQSGGIAYLMPDAAFAYKMPATETDTWELLQDLDNAFCFIERVAAMPKQGVSSTFKFGMHYGMLRGLLIAGRIPFETVIPRVWQQKLGCLSKGNKNVTKTKAQELFPCQRITHATADALLIAEYGRRVRGDA